ncbi:MAG TPA: MBL fold metallo-hydrolase [Rhizomicrobium sp.]|jgi:glyoxylase-like metal-dependent hydrolase (beta-lactamase superfamily II)|nr:MBL fold metallo-hydrolase [Rhizomicrobium sp.]
MNKWLRRFLIALAILAVLGGGAYYWLFLESGAPASSYTIDMAQVRRLAESMPGDKVREIRVERIESSAFPAIAVVAGDGWSPTPMTMFSYELVFPASLTVVDTGMPEGSAKQGGMTFDAAAFARMSKTLSAASLIVVTHEHDDHVGGLLAQPNLKTLLHATRLNAEQVANLGRYVPGYDRAAFAGYQPIVYDKYLAIAPGVVLIRAAGHTPGSQMVYVKTAAGAEFLFTGDVAWHMRNIDLVRERARLVTAFMLREDRGAVLAELAALNALKKAEPNLHMVTGHDPAPVDALERDGLLQAGFR